ncbi:hypothetical protein GCM10023187_17480 [Nibrella viscosa]|uniref:FAS1 domain-containing protein n=1 Tax=Nibrella viscosa TaxID=1084524 RepID=A0ABP8K9P8_9BACT
MLLSSTRSRQLSVLTLLMLLLTGCQPTDNAQPKTIADIILENNEFTLLRTAMLHGGMADALKGANLTLFAPNDAAFRASGLADPAAVTALPADSVRRLIQYHVLGGRIMSTDVNLPGGTNQGVVTAGGATVFLLKNNDQLFLNGVKISQADRVAANGTLHVIDRVLNPSSGNLLTTAKARGLNLLVAAALRASSTNPALLSALTGADVQITLFAPSDAALRAAGYTESSISTANPQTLAGLLSYHALPGVYFASQFPSGQLNTLLSNNRVTVTTLTNAVFVRGNRNPTSIPVRTADIVSNNGVIHIIDQVLLP